MSVGTYSLPALPYAYNVCRAIPVEPAALLNMVLAVVQLHV